MENARTGVNAQQSMGQTFNGFYLRQTAEVCHALKVGFVSEIYSSLLTNLKTCFKFSLQYILL